MSILVTGGLGYIGSHIVYQLLELDYSVIIIDNLSDMSDIMEDGEIARLAFVKASDMVEKRQNEIIYESAVAIQETSSL